MNDLSIAFKDEKIFKNFIEVPVHSNLQNLILWFIQNFGEPLTTSAYREGGKGVHSVLPLRGVDFRSWIYSHPQAIVDTINQVWEYDAKRPHLKCAMYHDIGQGAHIHIQVHDNTRKVS